MHVLCTCTEMDGKVFQHGGRWNSATQVMYDNGRVLPEKKVHLADKNFITIACYIKTRILSNLIILY